MSGYTIDVDSPKPRPFQQVSTHLAQGARKGVTAVTSVWDDFRAFINKGNVVDLAVGLVIGSAFTAVVNSVVSDLFTPLIALGLQSTSLPNSFIVMACPKTPGSNNREPIASCTGVNSVYGTVVQANTAGAVRISTYYRLRGIMETSYRIQ